MRAPLDIPYLDYMKSIRGPEGCAAHMAAGQAREALFAEFVDLVQTYMVSGLLAAPVIRTM